MNNQPQITKFDIITQIYNKLDSLLYSDNPAIAVSGGVDSMVMLDIAGQYCQRHNLKLHAVTIDHGLRQESADEAQFVANYIAKSRYAIEHHIIYWHKSKGLLNKNINQQDAREARYHLLYDYCYQNGISELIIAHHQNDIAEGLLINLSRGSGVDGVCGYRETRYQDSIHIIRPLLELTRKEIEQYAKAQNIPWCEDPSNQAAKYLRSHMRKIINDINDNDATTDNDGDDIGDSNNPAEHGQIGTIELAKFSLFAEHQNRISNYLKSKTLQILSKNFMISPLGYGVLKIADFMRIDSDEIMLRVLRSITMQIGGLKQPVRFASLSKLLLELRRYFDNLQSHEQSFYYNIGNCIITSHHNNLTGRVLLYIYRENRNFDNVLNLEELARQSKYLHYKWQGISWDNRFWCAFEQKYDNAIADILSQNLEKYYIKEIGKDGLKILFAEIGKQPLLNVVSSYENEFTSLPPANKNGDRAWLLSLPALWREGEIIAVPILDIWLDNPVKHAIKTIFRPVRQL